ncbi:zf-HC2 domain-containing protein [Cellulosimicrobium funkei]|uniref:anti-sigma factor family protein n=1 Tax=Cellulosimicrobium funkei TaxID=264251 RepID=UPI00342CE3B4
MTATPDPYREWDAAYVLGALSPRDRRAFEQHLATCAACREAVAELAGMPGILGMLTAEHADALVDDARTDHPAEASGGAGGAVVPLAVVAASARRRRTRRRSLLSVAAVGLVVAGAAGGAAATRSDDVPPPATTGTTATTQVALEPVGGADVRAELTLTPASWGTRLDWSCSYPAGVWEDGATYELVLVDDDGTRSVVATWSSTEAGSSSGLGASSAVPVDGIARLELGVVGVDGALAAADV